MSDLILPDFVGFAMDRKRNPEFSTRIKNTVSGREVRNRFSAYPRWHFTRPIEAIINDLDGYELDKLLGFYNAHGGQDDTWLYDCPGYNAATEILIGVGDGVNTTYQLRIIEPNYGFIEPVHNPKPFPVVLVDGLLQFINTDYVLSATGLVTFVTPPSNGAIVAWTGGYYHRCRFNVELPDFNESLPNVFDYADFSFIGSPVNLL